MNLWVGVCLYTHFWAFDPNPHGISNLFRGRGMRVWIFSGISHYIGGCKSIHLF